MNRRELERWVAASRARLAARGVSVVFAFGPSIDRAGGASWASFMSRRGEGRLVRSPNGCSRVDVYEFAGGACLRKDRADETTAEQLEQIADLLGPQPVVR